LSITVDSLCAEILDGWVLRQHTPGALGAYHRALLALMCQELGIEWHDDMKKLRHVWESSPAGLHLGDKSAIRWVRMPYMLNHMLERYDQIQTPFAGILEYDFAEGEEKIFGLHRHGIDEATKALRLRWQAYLRDMLLLRWPEAASRSTNWGRLAELGLPKRPHDPDDF
jgi:hypothetical protein